MGRVVSILGWVFGLLAVGAVGYGVGIVAQQAPWQAWQERAEPQQDQSRHQSAQQRTAAESALPVQLQQQRQFAQAQAQQETNGQARPPDDYGLVILIRNTIIALNHANLTGNYSVLRDMAAPGFREANNPARLAEIFADLRERGLDFGPVAVVDPRLSRQPQINEQGMLRLTGFFPTRPEQVNFDLAFQSVNGRWRLFGIGVHTSAAPDGADSEAAR